MPSLLDYFRPQQPGPFEPFNSRVTYYAPGPGDRMEGGFETSQPNPATGKRVPSTLDDVRLGTSPFVTLASDPSRYGQTINIGPQTYTSPIDQKTYTLPDVTGYVHDTGSAFRGRPDKLDVATGDFRGYSPQQASALVTADAGSRMVTPLSGDAADQAMRPIGLPEPWRATGEGENPPDAYASASAPVRKSMADSSLMDMFQPRSNVDNSPIGYGDAIAQNRASLIGLGMGLLQPRSLAVGAPTGSAFTNALAGYAQGAQADAANAYRQAQLAHTQRQEAFQRSQAAQAQSNFERTFARGDVTDAQRAMRDVLGPDATPDQKSAFMKNFYQSKTEGEWDLKDIQDPNNPDEKITVQQHKRTGEIRYPALPGQTGSAAAPNPFPAPGQTTGGGTAAVYGSGPSGFSATPSVGAAPGVPGGQRPAMAVTLPNGQVLSPPPGLSKDGRKAWTTHIAQTAADASSGKMTEAQSTSNLFAGKMVIANNQLDPETEKQGLDVVGNRLERYGGWAGNTILMPKEYQKYRDAKDAFLTAYLRRTSGANVRDPEYIREEKVFFPQPGDQPKQVEYKRQLRDDAIMRMKSQVGMGYKEPPAPPTATGGGGGGGTVKWIRDAQGNPVPSP